PRFCHLGSVQRRGESGSAGMPLIKRIAPLQPLPQSGFESCHPARRAQGSEWEALGNRRRDAETEKSFAGLVNTVILTVPANPAEEILHQGLVELARKASEHRDDRVSKSLTRIPTLSLGLCHDGGRAAVTGVRLPVPPIRWLARPVLIFSLL